MGEAEEVKNLTELKQDPHNFRKHNDRNVGAIKAAIQEVGTARSIVIDENDEIMAGNATVRAAQQAGVEKVRIIDAEGDEIIAVRRSGLTAWQKKRLALADNRAADLAEWDESEIEAAFQSDPSLFDELFTTEELSDIGVDLEDDEEAPSKAEIPFTRELMEAQNYVVFCFNNEFDWNVVAEHFGIQTVAALDSREGYERMGLGRVGDPQRLIDLIRHGLPVE